MAKKSIKEHQGEVLNEVKVPEDQVLHNTDDHKVEVKVPEINPASVVKIKALADTKHLKKDVVYEISGNDAIHLIKIKVAVLA